ncbi:MAG TPA: hypothetical protein VNJ08_12700 [Bacteriovoracaceae bacterium]|nr:hypothetical protein [Bacteriovoracaceae bacterium]
MQLFSLILMLVVLAGCGDLFGTKVVKKKLESERLKANCELDVNAFTDILKRNISTDIRCLEENLNLFIKVVKTDRPGHLSRISLEQFVIKNRPDIKPEMVRAMKAIFDVNYLITGEDQEFISQGNIKKMITFALLFNEKTSQHYLNTFGNTKQTPWDIYSFERGIVADSARSIVVGLRKIFKDDRKGEIHKLNVLDLLDNFTTEDNRDQLEKVKKMLFVKKIILGGSKEEITHVELERLLLNLQPLLTVAHDGIRFQYITIGQVKILEMLNLDLRDLDDLIHQGSLGNRDNKVLFTIDEMMDVARILIDKNDFDVDKFSNLIKEVKKLVMGGNDREVKGIELKALFNHGKTILKSGLSFHDFYRDFRIVMESPLPVTLNFNEYRHSYPHHQKELLTFERIVKKYRFFKGEFESAYFVTGFKRNADAIFEVYLLEYGIEMLFAKYGVKSPNADNPFSHSIDQFKMRDIFKKFEKDLIELKLVSPLWPTITADNVSLLGTLFQYQSDKNAVMDVNEATEFGITLITSLGVSEKIVDFMKDKKCSFDQFGRVEPDCVRRNFFPAICSQYRPYYPLMFSAINAPKICENIPQDEFNVAFLERAIVAARPCTHYTDGNKEEIWFTKDDINTMLMVILHAETTVLRWDTNANNILDADEVNKAYDIYSPALDGFLESRPAIIKKFKKQIYQYLIKYEQVPDEKNFSSVWKFIKFLMSFNKAHPATRKTITSVLMAIGEENKKLPGAPQIDCNYLRDPDTIPTAVVPRASFLKDNRTDHSGLLNGFLEYID